MSRARVIGSLFSLLLAYGNAHAETLVVPDQFPSIQAAINSAVEGDTVLVRPGTYQEAIAWANKNLTLRGDGLEPPVIITTGSTSTVMSVGPGMTQQSVIESLTIRDGLAEQGGEQGGKQGGGMTLVGSSPVIQHCLFEANVAAVPYDGSNNGPSRGGALFVNSGSSPVVTDCSFTQNQSRGSLPFFAVWWGEGGAIYVEPGGSLEVRRCRFEENAAQGAPEGGAGGAIRVDTQASAAIDSCTFERNFAGGGAGVSSEGQAAVRDCVFKDNDGWSGAAILAFGTCSVENSLFFGNFVWGSEGTIGVLGTGQIRNNTVAFNESPEGMGNAGIAMLSGTVAGNIISQNLGWGVFECPEDPEAFSCNDVWGNTRGGAPANYRSCPDMTGMNGNISADPLFCDAASDNYRLMPESPCAPENSPVGCGLIGALPVCQVAGTEAGHLPLPQVELVIQPNPVTSVAEFILGKGAKLTVLEVYDSTGRLVDQIQSTRTRITWVAPADIPSGVYFARFEHGGVSRAVKFALIR